MLLPIKKILVPTDFSELSYKGIEAAVELAKHFKAELHLVHIVNPIPISSGSLASAGGYLPTLLEEIEASAKDSIQSIAKTHIPDDIQTYSNVYIGTTAEEITKIAATEDVDIIVIASHGQSGWKRFILGSVTERVIRLADRPVLTICSPELDAEQSNDN